MTMIMMIIINVI